MGPIQKGVHVGGTPGAGPTTRWMSPRLGPGWTRRQTSQLPVGRTACHCVSLGGGRGRPGIADLHTAAMPVKSARAVGVAGAALVAANLLATGQGLLVRACVLADHRSRGL